MTLALLPLFPLVINALIGLVFAWRNFSYRHAAGAQALLAMLCAASWWSVGYALEIASLELPAKLFWAKIEYLAIAFLPLTWFTFSYQYLGSPPWFERKRKYYRLLFIIPIITLALAWTNELHGLIWKGIQLREWGPLTMIDFNQGLWFYIHVSYTYLLLVWGSLWLLPRLVNSNRLFRWQVGLAMAGAIIPWLGNLSYVTHINPWIYLDWTPFGFTLAGLLLSVSLFRFHLGQVVPIAHRTVFEELVDGLLILDPQDRIIDLNLAAQKLIARPSSSLLGLRLGQVLPGLAGFLKDERLHVEVYGELAFPRGAASNYFELNILPLFNRSAATIGRLVILHDITQRKQEQAALMKAYAELEDRVAERTAALQVANQQLAEELEQRRLAEGRFEDILNNAPTAMLLIDPDGKIILANAQAETMFGWPVSDLNQMFLSDLLPEDLRPGYPRWLQQFFANPARIQIDPQLNLRGLRRDRTEFPVEVNLSPLKTTLGVLAACDIRDITRRKQAEQGQANLLREIRESHEQLRLLTASLAEAEEIERRKIAVELHDRVGQNLTALNLNLTSVHLKLPGEADESLHARLADSLALIEETTRQVRDVMAELNPPMLEEFGLLPALRWYGERFSSRTGIQVAITGEECQPRPPHRMEITLFRIIQEALNNVARHARATRVAISCSRSGETVRLIIEDDGVGFDPSEIDAIGEQPHWGLLTMKERALSIEGRLVVQSAPGKGTRVVVEIGRVNNDD